MIAVVKNPEYVIGIDPITDKPWLLFDTVYENQPESVCIELPDNAWRTYQKKGDEEFVSWVKRINEDYQVGRFSKDNPRIFTDYQLATPKQTQQLIESAEQHVSLIEQEALRLLFSCPTIYTTLATGCVTQFLSRGKSIPIEIFCLAFRFYDNDKPLLNEQGHELLAANHLQAALDKLSRNPVAGCPDAATLALGLLTRTDNNVHAFHHLNRLERLKQEFNFRYLRDRLDYYLEQYNNLAQTGTEDLQAIEKLLNEYRIEFPAKPNFTKINNKEYLPGFLFMEEALAWEWDCKKCLETCFLNNQIPVTYNNVKELLHLPSGRDDHWHSYSIGQSIKYCPEDPAFFTKETVKKPKFPSAGYENFIIGVWQHYFRFFKPGVSVSREELSNVLQEFVVEWNE